LLILPVGRGGDPEGLSWGDTPLPFTSGIIIYMAKDHVEIPTGPEISGGVPRRKNLIFIARDVVDSSVAPTSWFSSASKARYCKAPARSTLLLSRS